MRHKKDIAERGTPLWSLNRFRSDLLPNLLDDLATAEKPGLLDAHCDEVKRALDRMVNQAAGIPDGGFLSLRPTIWEALRDFETTYHEWNSVSGNHEMAQKHRNTARQKLRKKLNRFSTRIRFNQHVLSENLDLRFIEACHQAMADLVVAVPTIFLELGKAVARYQKVQMQLPL